MSKLAKDFCFNDANLQKAKNIIIRYPEDRSQSALIPLLDIAQRQVGGWLTKESVEYVANFLNIPPIRVYEVATFYTMFNLHPIGKYHVQICGTTPCWLRGSDEIVKACENKLRIKCGETTADKKFTLVEVECLGACVNAPMVQINDNYFEDLTPEIISDILGKMQEEQPVKIGSQVGRNGSEPKN